MDSGSVRLPVCQLKQKFRQETAAAIMGNISRQPHSFSQTGGDVSGASERDSDVTQKVPTPHMKLCGVSHGTGHGKKRGSQSYAVSMGNMDWPC
jgi:hypothetical protein